MIGAGIIADSTEFGEIHNYLENSPLDRVKRFRGFYKEKNWVNTFIEYNGGIPLIPRVSERCETDFYEIICRKLM